MSAQARADIPSADLEAAVRALGFLDTLQRHAPISIAVVYKGGDAESRVLAQRAATTFASIPGPYGSVLSANAIAANDLTQGSRRYDVVYLAPGSLEQGRAVADYARRMRVLTISGDPACLNVQCCALMVRAGARTEIVLDTAVARETGASFSSVFLMMVKRR